MFIISELINGTILKKFLLCTVYFYLLLKKMGPENSYSFTTLVSTTYKHFSTTNILQLYTTF